MSNRQPKLIEFINQTLEGPLDPMGFKEDPCSCGTNEVGLCEFCGHRKLLLNCKSMIERLYYALRVIRDSGGEDGAMHSGDGHAWCRVYAKQAIELEGELEEEQDDA